jgi:hypothetical protein
MRKFIVAATAIAALAVPAIAPAVSSAAGSVTTCDHDMSGQTVPGGTIDVPKGTICNLTNANISANLTVEGELVSFGGVFPKNVTVNEGGQFEAMNNGVEIDGNLSITNPGIGSPWSGNGNGFWGNQYGTSNLVKGNVSFTMDPSKYQDYTWPYLYFGGGTKVNGTLTYNVHGLPERAVSSAGAFQGLTLGGRATLS